MADADPRELTAGYVYPRGKGVSYTAGVLRDGRQEVWRCVTAIPGHRGHLVPGMSQQCAEAELERRRQGALAVFWLHRCGPCGLYYDLSSGTPGDLIEELLAGRCPRCATPVSRVKVAVLERQEASVR